MEIQIAHRVSLATVCARLRFLLELFQGHGVMHGDSSVWYSVGNLLLPPASVSRVVTDASASDLYNAWSFCSCASTYDDQQSDLLDDYMLELVRFHFVWNAYESIRHRSLSGQKLISSSNKARLELLNAVPPAHVDLVTSVYQISLSLATDNTAIRRRLAKGNEVSLLGKAGLLIAGFRDHIFHGDDNLPEPDDSENLMMDNGLQSLSVGAYRMAWFTRLTLHMIQSLTYAEFTDEVPVVPVNDVPFLSRYYDCEFDIPCKFAITLANWFSEELTTRLSEGDIVKCCGWRRAHPDGLGGGFDVTILKFDALDDEFYEFVTV